MLSGIGEDGGIGRQIEGAPACLDEVLDVVATDLRIVFGGAEGPGDERAAGSDPADPASRPGVGPTLTPTAPLPTVNTPTATPTRATATPMTPSPTPTLFDWGFQVFLPLAETASTGQE